MYSVTNTSYKKQMKKLTILHISDTHIERSSKDEIIGIREKLLSDVKKVQVEKRISIDLVCFTGDLIQRGDQAQCGENQWEFAWDIMIKPILRGLGLSGDRFIFVPGNHEVDKTKIVIGLDRGLQVQTLEEISETVRTFDESYKSRLAYFYSIVKQELPSANMKNLGYTYKIWINGLNVGVACVDSAWRSAGKGLMEKGKLYISHEQVDNLYRDISECDVKICMMHHPVEWMLDSEVKVIYRSLTQFDLVLRGHVHEEDDEQIIRNSKRTVYSTAGKLYPIDRDYNGYSIIHITPSTHKCRIFLRTYFSGEREDFDAAVDNCEGGEKSYDIWDEGNNGIQQYVKTMSEKYALLRNIDTSLSKPRISKGYPSYYNLEHENIDIDYYVHETSIIYIKSCKSKVLAGGKNRIHNRITWFADETIELVSLTDGVYIERLDLRDTNLNYNVVFDHILEVGEEIEFRIKAILSNEKQHFENFFSTEVIAPINNLNIHLNLSDKSVKKVFTQELSSSPMNFRSEPPKEHSFFSPYHWRIPNPKLNYEYKIYW